MGPRVRLSLVVLALTFAASTALTIVHADVTAADIFIQAGDSLARAWRYRDALAMYNRAEAVGSGPDRVRATIRVASTAMRLAEFELAFSKAATLVEAFPQDLDVRATYGQAAWCAGLFGEANSAFRDVLARSPRDARALLGMARVLTARNHLDAALEHALAAATLSPESADACSVVAFIYRRLGRLDQAIVWHRKYLAMLPARESDKQSWTQSEVQFLRSFGRQMPAEIDARSRAIVHAIPVRLVNDKVLVKARVNESEWVEFVLDTGAEQTVLSQATARRLGVVAVSDTVSAGVGEIGLRGLQNARLDSLQIGSLMIRNVPCLIKSPPLTDLPSRESESLSPLALGLSAVIDYKRKELLLGTDLAAEPHDIEMPLWFSRLATVRGVVNGERDASFIVDTGGEVVSISQDTARTLSTLPAGRRIPLIVFGTSGRDRDAYLQTGVTLTFDTVRAANGSVVVLNLRAPSVLLGYRVGGTIGHQFLRTYRVTFDLKRSVLGLSKLY